MKNINYLYQTEDALLNLLKFKIRFSQSNNAYLLNDKWVNEIDEHYFSNKAEKVQKLLNKQLKHGKCHEVLLEKLVSRIWNRLQFIKKYRMITPEIIKEYSEIKDPVIAHKETPYSSADWYEQFKEGNSLEANFGNDRLIYLVSNSKKLNNYETRIDFEYGLLSYAIQKYIEAINHLHGYVFSLNQNARFIDFKCLDIEESSSKVTDHRSCHFNLNKKQIAHLFKILFDENIIVFDENNESQNNIKMKRFVEDNFTYQHRDDQRRLTIKKFTREYSEVSSSLSPDVKKHKQFIDELIHMLNQRKQRIKD